MFEFFFLNLVCTFFEIPKDNSAVKNEVYKYSFPLGPCWDAARFVFFPQFTPEKKKEENMSFLFPIIPTAIPILSKAGTAFPVRRVYCVGQNYSSHAKEMGAVPRTAGKKEEPFWFLKPTDSIVSSTNGKMTVPIPPRTSKYDFELELVVALQKGGANVAPQDVPGMIFGYAVGLDMTRRDLQKLSKEKGRPWDLAKGADFSSPISPIVEMQNVVLKKGPIQLTLDGTVKQSSDLSELITPVDELISILSSYVELQAGDLIFTGTPEGVGPVTYGQTVVGKVGGLDVTLEVQFIQRSQL